MTKGSVNPAATIRTQIKPAGIREGGEMKNLGLVYRVLEDATFTDMSSGNYGQSYPAPHRGEEGIVVGGYDDMPVLRFADGDEVQFGLSNIERI